MKFRLWLIRKLLPKDYSIFSTPAGGEGHWFVGWQAKPLSGTFTGTTDTSFINLAGDVHGQEA